ncbi:TetR/AcrR family transcriptional regulator [Paralimibaculum aggregatum]|uniref:TetR/AcrR family transcriptional regulator n=1 Tax=Paralimibaculum aggregatum TaxID=3036245 RepID=A0ABQ6LSB2_9RHOB|nr:TetR/AcrR family transcriptional regulator [Limibaculum sp. NKW23]GMG84951.1 TetR/AcrR family transcriptional regulator [Limibaculum sp. NKW23]
MPPPSEPEAANKAARGGDSDAPRQEIVKAAAELFMDLGYRATSIDAIAERMGSTKGRVYHWYRSKAEIYFDVQRSAMRRLTELVEPIAREGGPPQQRIERMARAHVDCLLHDLPMQKVSVQGLETHVITSDSVRHAKAMREIVGLRDAYEALFCEVIDEGIRAGVFVDLPPRLLSKPFFGALNWVTIWYRPRRLQTEDDLQMLGEMLTEFAVRGILKERN